MPACHFCATELPIFGYVNGNHWTGTEYVRVDLCSDCYSAGQLAKAPRRPRKPRATVAPATDWNYLVAFSNGRKAASR